MSAHWINGAGGAGVGAGAGIHDSIRELQQASLRTMDRIERRYSGRVQAELLRRREIERETDEEIRAAIEEVTR